MLPKHKILCPTDFSDASRVALLKAGELGAHFGATLHPLYVTQMAHPLSSFSAYGSYVDFASAGYEQNTLNAMQRHLERFIEPLQLSVEVQLLVRSGLPAEEIVAAADEEGCDLLVIATHGTTGWRRHIFGSVTEKVLRLAQCPVLIVRDENAAHTLNLPLRKILCSTDFSQPSLAALDVAQEWAGHFGAELCVAHIVEPLENAGLVLDKAQIEASVQSDAAERLQQLVAERWPTNSAVRTRVSLGSAADEFTRIADEENADLVVMSTHGASGWRAAISGTEVERVLFGSVTTNVMRLSSRPILTVHSTGTPAENTSASVD